MFLSSVCLLKTKDLALRFSYCVPHFLADLKYSGKFSWILFVGVGFQRKSMAENRLVVVLSYYELSTSYQVVFGFLFNPLVAVNCFSFF